MISTNDLKKMQSGEKFATGTGTYEEIYANPIRWVAVRGNGYHDWAIYYGFLDMTVEDIVRVGDKMFIETVIKRLVPCTEDAYKLYRR